VECGGLAAAFSTAAAPRIRRQPPFFRLQPRPDESDASAVLTSIAGNALGAQPPAAARALLRPTQQEIVAASVSGREIFRDVSGDAG